MSAKSSFRLLKDAKSQRQYKRSLHMEALEERALLSVNPWNSDDGEAMQAVVMEAEDGLTSEKTVLMDLEGEYLQVQKTPDLPETDEYAGNDVGALEPLLTLTDPIRTEFIAGINLGSESMTVSLDVSGFAPLELSDPFGDTLIPMNVSEDTFSFDDLPNIEYETAEVMRLDYPEYDFVSNEWTDRLEACSEEIASAVSNRAVDAPGTYSTSDIMIGDVYVQVILLESNGKYDVSKENWSSTRIAEVKSEILTSLQWWEDTFDKYNPNSPIDLTFHVDFTYANTPFKTQYEPIKHSSKQDYLWVNEFLASQNYPTGSTRNQTNTELIKYCDDLRKTHNCDWAFTVFVADSLLDSDGMFTNETFAYAYRGGPRVQLTYDNANWEIDDMDVVLAHEICHIFWGLDEYNTASQYDYNTSWDDTGGYYNIQNLNAWNTPYTRTDSLMADSRRQKNAWKNHMSSTSSLQMIGWRDSDGDGLIDYLDQPLTMTNTNGSWNSSTKTFKFSGHSAVTCMKNHTSRSDHTLNTVDVLRYKIDNGSWKTVQTWSNTSRVDFNVSVNVNTTSGKHTITFQTYCKRTGVTSEEVTYSFTYSGVSELSAPTLSVSAKSSNSIAVTVGRVSNASKYQLQYSTDPNFSNTSVTTTINVAEGTTVIGGLNPNTKYYFRVKAVGSGSYTSSQYSAAKSATTLVATSNSDFYYLQNFLEKTDSSGEKNGKKINSNYNANDTSTWTGVTWTTINGEMRVTRIDWSGRQLVGSLDLSGCTALTYLNCGSNSLTQLKLTNCTALTYLYCNSNNLTVLNISGCTSLLSLYCYYNQLAVLDVSKCTLLKTLYCDSNQLSELNVSKNTKLTWFSCTSNQLTSLNVSNNTALQTFYCDYNQLTSLNVSNNTALTYLNCCSNQISSLDMTNNTLLTYLNCRSNQLSSLNVSRNTALQTLYCYSNELTSLNVSNCTALTTLYCYSNALTSLNVSGCTALTALYCYYNQLTTLNVTNNTALTKLDCDNNQLTGLNLSNNTALMTLYCNANQLTSLDLSKNTALAYLYCSSNKQLTSLNVSNHTELISLCCYNNQLTSLNVTGCTKLETLRCYSNLLTSLNVTQNTALTWLDCDYNQLTELDLSKNVQLTKLWCWNSSFNSVKLSPNRTQNLTIYLPNTWTFKDENNRTIGTNSPDQNYSEYSYTLSLSTTLPVYAVNASGTQTIAFMDSLRLTVPTFNVSVAGSNSVSVTVGSVANTTEYELSYSTDRNFSYSATSTVRIPAGQRTINNLAANTTYYFRVRAVGSGSYSNSPYSPVIQVKTNAIKLSAPSLSVTAVGTSSISVTVGSVANASGYTLQYSTSSTFTNATSKTVVAGTSSVSGLNASTVYYFRVMASGSGDYSNSDYSATKSAETKSSKLPSPTLSVKTSGSSSVSVTVGSVENASGYTLMYSTNPNFTSAVTRSILPGTSTVGGLNSDTTYYFRVMAIGSRYYNDSDYSSAQSAKTNSSKLKAPTLSVSAAGSNAVFVTVGSVPSASGYKLQYSTSESFANAESQIVQAGTNTINDLEPETKYYFRVMALGTVDYSNSDYSESQWVVVKSEYIPSDVDCLRQFLEQTDSNGITNGKKINSNYNPNDIGTWNVTWGQDNNGSQRVKNISKWFNKQLVGVLDVSDCTSLTSLLCYGNQLTSVNVSGCTNLTCLWCENNQLTSLDVSGCTRLTELRCGSNPLTYLDVLGCPALEYLDCWSPELEAVSFYSGTQYIAINLDTQAKWTFKDASGRVLGTSWTLEYSTNDYITLPFTAVSADGRQTIRFVNTRIEPLATPTLSIGANGSRSVTALVEGVAHTSRYLLQYSTSGNFANAVSQYVSAGISTIGGLRPDTTYYFRLQAVGWGNYSNSKFSETQTVTTDVTGDLDVSIAGKKITVYWEDTNPMADIVRYRAVGTTQWKTQKLRDGVTMYSFNGNLGTSYEIEVFLDQQGNNLLQGVAVVLDQPKLGADKTFIKDDTFRVNVTNYFAKNLAANATQAIISINGIPTAMDITEQEGTAALAGGGYVAFTNGLFMFSGMNSNTQYKVQISFSDGVSTSTPSSALSVKTLKTCYQAPALTSATAVSDSSILVTWNTAYGKNSNVPAQKYTVQYSLDGVKWSNATTSATGNSFTIQKLKGGFVYQVRVFASKDKMFEASAVNNVLSAETLALPKVTLDKASITDDSFRLNVTNYLNSNLTRASVMKVTSDKLGTTSIILQNGAGSASFTGGGAVTFNNGLLTFTNVPSNTQQKIQVCFVLGTCTTAWSQALTVKTTLAAYNKPTLTNVYAVSGTSVTVNWETVYGKNSNTRAQYYTVQYSTDGVRWTNATTKATGTSFTITRLKPGTQYLIAVIATKDSQFNASQPSNSKLVLTPYY